MWLLLSEARRPGVMEVMHNLDYCDVMLIGEELNPERESLEIHHSALLGKHLDATNSTSGISIYGNEDQTCVIVLQTGTYCTMYFVVMRFRFVWQGVDSMAHYEQALRQVRYRSWQPATLIERRFRLTCSELNGRYTSNEFNMEVGLKSLCPTSSTIALCHLSCVVFCIFSLHKLLLSLW